MLSNQSERFPSQRCRQKVSLAVGIPQSSGFVEIFGPFDNATENSEHASLTSAGDGDLGRVPARAENPCSRSGGAPSDKRPSGPARTTEEPDPNQKGGAKEGVRARPRPGDIRGVWVVIDLRQRRALRRSLVPEEEREVPRKGKT